MGELIFGVDFRARQPTESAQLLSQAMEAVFVDLRGIEYAEFLADIGCPPHKIDGEVAKFLNQPDKDSA